MTAHDLFDQEPEKENHTLCLWKTTKANIVFLKSKHKKLKLYDRIRKKVDEAVNEVMEELGEVPPQTQSGR
jgi:hypothetical protein